MKKILSLFLVAVMIISMFAGLQISSSAFEPTGQCGDNVYWSFEESTGTLTISGEGEMYDYGWEGSPFSGQSNIKTVIINSGVTSVSADAFYTCGSLEKVTIFDTVTHIGDHSFGKCSALREVKLSNSLLEISGSVFSDCTHLEEIIIPDSIKSIGENAFFGCGALKNIIIPDSVTGIYNLAFAQCTSISSIIIPKSVISLGMAVFDSCDNLKNIKVDEDNSIYDSRDNCNAIIESKSNKLICACNATVIPETVTTIAQGVFSNIKDLTSINIPVSITYIDYFAFDNCKNLNNVYYQGSMEQWKGIKIEPGNDYLTKANIYFNGVAHKHSYTKVIVQSKATAVGYTQYKCSCGEFKKDAKGNVIKDNFTAPTGKPSGFKCSARTASAMKFVWSKTSGVTGYQVQISTKDVKKWDKAYNAKTATSYTVKGLTAGSAYKVRVRFYITKNGKNYFGQWTTINSPTLPTGTSLSKVTSAKKAFTAQWKKVAVTGYQLQYGTNAKFSGAKTLTVKGKTAQAVKSLKSGARYYVRVRTYKTIGGKNYFSTWSGAKAVTTKK